MQTHLANTFFEHELQGEIHTLEEWLHSHPLISQLQFLPLLYRKSGEKVLVSKLPQEEYLLYLKHLGFAIDGIEEISFPNTPFELNSWGASQVLASWAQQRGGTCTFPDWDIVRQVHSKVYAFAAAPQLPDSHLLQTIEDAEEWVATLKGPKVLKQAFGFSGAGHIHCDQELPPKAIALLKKREVLIGEPWVKRIFDFSTQWLINSSVEYLGATVLGVTEKGTYSSTLVGDENLLFRDHLGALQQHLDLCRPLLEKVRKAGFFGHLGIDAFVYEKQGKHVLRAVSEINARKTMGWAALQLQRLHFPNKQLQLRYETSTQRGLLPQRLGAVEFRKQLHFSIE